MLLILFFLLLSSVGVRFILCELVYMYVCQGNGNNFGKGTNGWLDVTMMEITSAISDGKLFLSKYLFFLGTITERKQKKVSFSVGAH